MKLDARLQQLKDIKKKGIKIVGFFPNGYLPDEIIYASGAVPVPLLRGGDPEPVAVAGAYLGRFMDPFCRAQIGYRVLKESLYQMIDLLVVPLTDHHTRAVADSWHFYSDVDVFQLRVPHVKTREGLEYYNRELHRLKGRLQELTGVEIEEARLRREVALGNEIRGLLRDISLTRRSESPPISGGEFIGLNQSTLYLDRDEILGSLRSQRDEVVQKKAATPKGPRILLTGSTLALGDSKVVEILEKCGASVVVEEFCEGLRKYWCGVEAAGDPFEALARGYFGDPVPPAFFRGSAEERLSFLLKLAKEFRVDAMVWYSLMYRETYDLEGYLFSEILRQHDLPMLRIVSNYDPGELGGLRTRIETFVETVREGKKTSG